MLPNLGSIFFTFLCSDIFIFEGILFLFFLIFAEAKAQMMILKE